MINVIKKITIVALVFLIGCSKNVEIKNEFLPYPEFIDSLDINPEIKFDYFEYKIGPNSKRTYFSKKQHLKFNHKYYSSVFDSINVDSGFSKFPHHFGFNYILSVKNDSITIWNTIPKLKQFLGVIDTNTEAQLYILAHGYPPEINDTTETSVKRVNDYFIVRASKMDSLCAPIIKNTYTFKLYKNGVIDTIDIKESSRDPKGCI